MNAYQEALEVLLILRRRQLDRLASEVVAHRQALLNQPMRAGKPLAVHEPVCELVASLAELETAISGLTPLTREEEKAVPAPRRRRRPPASDRQQASSERRAPFTRFWMLVEHNRQEEAARELSRTLKMSQDRMITATRFFTRAVKADASVLTELDRLCEHFESWPEVDCIRALIRIFGFQAVESLQALYALRAFADATEEAPVPA